MRELRLAIGNDSVWAELEATRGPRLRITGELFHAHAEQAGPAVVVWVLRLAAAEQASRDRVAVPPSPHQVGAAALVTRDWDAIRSELLPMAEDDRTLRAELARDGSLFRGYHPAMRALHDRNAERLGVLLECHGWPGRSQVGEPAAHAAWFVLQHAIGHPPLMRRGLALLREASARGDAAALEVAMLEDRIRTFEGRPQRYGTQFDWDELGELRSNAIEDAGHVDERRRALGLAPLAVIDKEVVH